MEDTEQWQIDIMAKAIGITAKLMNDVSFVVNECTEKGAKDTIEALDQIFRILEDGPLIEDTQDPPDW